jgi:hypothetical protein
LFVDFRTTRHLIPLSSVVTIARSRRLGSPQFASFD